MTTRIRRFSVRFLSVLALGLSFVATAQEGGEDATVAPVPEPAPVATEAAGDAQASGQNGLISMSVSDAKLQDVLQLLAAMRPGVNIVMGSNVEGTVPLLTVQDAEFDEALNMLAEASNLRVTEKDENTYRVEKIIELPPGALRIELLAPGMVAQLPLETVRSLTADEPEAGEMSEAELREFLRENAGDHVARLSVTDADPLRVVNELAMKSELNFAFSPGAWRQSAPTAPEGEAAPEQVAPTTPPVTLNLRYMSVIDALKMVATQGGMSCTLNKGVWVVTPLPPQKLKQEPLQMETFELSYIRVDDELLALCKSLISDRGTVSCGKNRILVARDTSEGIGAIRTALEAMDIPTPQVLIEARFFELSENFNEYLGIEWNTFGKDGLSVSTGPVSIEDALTETTQKSWDYGNSSQSTSVTDTQTTDLATGAITGSTTTTTETTNNGSGITADTRDEAYTRDTKATILNVGQVSAILHALRNSDNANQLSNPKIVVSSDEQATIHIGDQTPILKSSTEGDNGVKSYELDSDFGGKTIQEVDLLGSEEGERAQMASYETPKGYLDLGTKLSVAPSVKTEDKIYIKVTPELVTLTGYETTASGDRYPQLFSTRVNTQFTIKSGQTIAIGGLVNERDRVHESKVPLLGSIPLLGRAFRYESTERTKTETIIFLTVKIIPSESMRTTSGIPIRAHMVQEEVERIKEEDARGAEYTEEHARQLMKQAVQDAREDNWPAQKLRDRLGKILSGSKADEKTEEADTQETPVGEQEATPDTPESVPDETAPAEDAQPQTSSSPGTDASEQTATDPAQPETSSSPGTDASEQTATDPAPPPPAPAESPTLTE